MIDNLFNVWNITLPVALSLSDPPNSSLHQKESEEKSWAQLTAILQQLPILWKPSFKSLFLYSSFGLVIMLKQYLFHFPWKTANVSVTFLEGKKFFCVSPTFFCLFFFIPYPEFLLSGQPWNAASMQYRLQPYWKSAQRGLLKRWKERGFWPAVCSSKCWTSTLRKCHGIFNHEAKMFACYPVSLPFEGGRAESVLPETDLWV